MDIDRTPGRRQPSIVMLCRSLWRATTVDEVEGRRGPLKIVAEDLEGERRLARTSANEARRPWRIPTVKDPGTGTGTNSPSIGSVARPYRILAPDPGPLILSPVARIRSF